MIFASAKLWQNYWCRVMLEECDKPLSSKTPSPYLANDTAVNFIFFLRKLLKTSNICSANNKMPVIDIHSKSSNTIFFTKCDRFFFISALNGPINRGRSFSFLQIVNVDRTSRIPKKTVAITFPAER